jgi:hypothetical protein
MNAMTAMHWPAWWRVAAFGLGLVLTLVLAGCLTPRRWWQRPTARNLALAGGGTLAFGALFAALFGTLFATQFATPLPAAPAAMPLSVAPGRQVQLTSAAPALRYRVIEDLNLRAAKATGATRLAILPAGTLVHPTGTADGDWWQVRARLKGRQIEGWASSLWLRRVDEGAIQD